MEKGQFNWPTPRKNVENMYFGIIYKRMNQSDKEQPVHLLIRPI